MRLTSTWVLRVAAAFLAILLATPAGAVGFQLAQIPQPDGRTLPGAFWYPSLAPPRPMTAGMVEQAVAQDAPVDGIDHPLIVISHGALGNRLENTDLAIALADAGFVVASVSHDEFEGRPEFQTVDRVIQLHALIDYALSGWPGHGHIDGSEVGAFGFSLGGFTVLVASGGKPDPSLIAPHCRAAPSEWSCQMAAKLDLARAAPQPSAWQADGRIKAAVLAAPALGYVFGPSGLSAVTIPVQLWEAGHDQVLAEPWNVRAVQAELPKPPDFHLVDGADHADFGSLCSAALRASMKVWCGGPPGFDRTALHAAMNKAVVAFFKHALQPVP